MENNLSPEHIVMLSCSSAALVVLLGGLVLLWRNGEKRIDEQLAMIDAVNNGDFGDNIPLAIAVHRKSIREGVFAPGNTDKILAVLGTADAKEKVESKNAKRV